MAVQFCGTCGHPLIPDQLFCQHCGSRVDENAARAVMSAAPGTPLSSGGTLYCGECGALVGRQDRTCRRCGAPIEPSPGLVIDPSLSDLPTRMATPPPPANQDSTPLPGYQAHPPKGWAASYSPGPIDELPTFTDSSPRPAVQTPPYKPAGPGGPPRQRQRWPLVLVVVLVALALIVGGSAFLLLQGSSSPQTNGATPTPSSGTIQTPGVTSTPGITPSPTPVVLNEETASDLIRQYYDYINAKNYNAAYDLFAPALQQKQSRQNFIDGFKNTLHDTLTIESAAQQDDGNIRVDVQLKAEETGGIRYFAGYYIVTKQNEKLLILSGNLDEVLS